MNPTLGEFDYLLTIPATDSAFEAGASVATRSELATAIVRHEAYRTAALSERDDQDQHINMAVVPVVVALTKLDRK